MKRIKEQLILGLLLSSPSLSFALCIALGCTCNISTSTFNFGTYAPLSGNSLSNSNNLSVTCSALIANLNVSYVISFSQGSSGSYTPRTMKFSTYNLNYNLYKDSSHTIILGDGTSATQTISDSYVLLLLSVTRNYTMYGLVPPSQSVAAGNYSDSVTATVTF